MTFIKKLTKLKKFFTKREKLQNKIYFSISSEGFGHSSRILAIAKHLDQRFFLIGTYGYAYERLKKMGMPCVQVSQELKLVGHDGAFDVAKTILQNQSWLVKFNKMVDEEVEILKKSGASCVVADGRLVPVMAAERLKLPCINITNQSAFYPFFEQDSWLVRLLGVPFDALMRMYLSSTEEILIPDFEPPYTVCLYNLSKNKKVMKRTRFVGPLITFNPSEVVPVEHPEGKHYIVVSLGGHDYRKPIFDFLLKVAPEFPDCIFEVFTTFKEENIPANVRVNKMIADISPYLKAADMIITQAGHSTAMEVLALGKPSLVIPDLNQIEQENNAKKMAEMGVAEKLTYDELSETTMKQCIQKVMNDEKYKQKAQFFATMYMGFGANEKVVEILKDYAMRLHRY